MWDNSINKTHSVSPWSAGDEEQCGADGRMSAGKILKAELSYRVGDGHLY